MGSSVPAALDYLVENIGRLPVLDEIRPRPAVEDGWPAVRSDTLIVVAGTSDNDPQSLAQSYAQLSGQEHEDVTIVSTIWVKRRTSKVARADAFRILDAINELVRADRRFGGAILTGMEAHIVAVRTTQTPGAKSAGEGRTCEVRWTLSWQHRG